MMADRDAAIAMCDIWDNMQDLLKPGTKQQAARVLMDAFAEFDFDPEDACEEVYLYARGFGRKGKPLD